MKSFLFSISFVIGMLVAIPASAQWQAAVGAGVRYVHMIETAPDGQRLVREHGWLPGVAATIAYRVDDWRYGLSGEIFRADLNYDGRLQNGLPFITDTETMQHRMTAEVSRAWNDQVSAIGALEYDVWQRDVSGRGTVAGVRERYASWRLLAGISTTMWHVPAASIEFKGLLVLASPERLRVRFDNQLYDEARLSTRPAAGVRLALAAQPRALPNLSLAIDFDWMHIKRSEDAALRRNGAVVGTVAQPAHRRSAIGLRANYHF